MDIKELCQARKIIPIQFLEVPKNISCNFTNGRSYQLLQSVESIRGHLRCTYGGPISDHNNAINIYMRKAHLGGRLSLRLTHFTFSEDQPFSDNTLFRLLTHQTFLGAHCHAYDFPFPPFHSENSHLRCFEGSAVIVMKFLNLLCLLTSGTVVTRPALSPPEVFLTALVREGAYVLHRNYWSSTFFNRSQCKCFWAAK